MNTEISNQFVSFEIAKKLKELGFDDGCLGEYNRFGTFVKYRQNHYYKIGYANESDDTLDTYNNSSIKMGEFSSCCAPMWQQLIDWLRKEHNIQFSVSSYTINVNKKWVDWIYNIRTINGGISLDSRDGLDSYEEAREMGILKTLELIEKQK